MSLPRERPPIPPRFGIGRGGGSTMSFDSNGGVFPTFPYNQYGTESFSKSKPIPINRGFSGIYGYNTPLEGSLAKLVEESSRGAFQNIESAVLAISSTANLLTSTYNAVYSSFRALITVVEQVSRLKSQLVSVLVKTSLVRWLKIIWHHLLVFFRLRSTNYATNQNIWEKSVSSNDLTINWPSMCFWLVALGGPWLIYKCITIVLKSNELDRIWEIEKGVDHYVGKALYDFNGQHDDELSFQAGDLLYIAPQRQQPQIRGWLLASLTDSSRIGLVPINYVEVMKKKETNVKFEGHQKQQHFGNLCDSLC